MFWRDTELAALAGTAAAQKLARGAGASKELCSVELPCEVSEQLSVHSSPLQLQTRAALAAGKMVTFVQWCRVQMRSCLLQVRCS